MGVLVQWAMNLMLLNLSMGKFGREVRLPEGVTLGRGCRDRRCRGGSRR